jgi:addiction module HigA family antidote
MNGKHCDGAHSAEQASGYFATADELAVKVRAALRVPESTRLARQLEATDVILKAQELGPSYMMNIMDKPGFLGEVQFVELQMGPTPWWNTRLYLVAALAHEFGRTRDFVFQGFSTFRPDFWMTLRFLPAIGSTRLGGTGRDNTPSLSTTNGVSVSGSSLEMPTMSTSQTITETRGDMSITNTENREVRPTHPGEMLREDFLPDYGLTVSGLADALGVSRQTVNELLRERRALSPKMALRLSRLFGNSPEFWLNAQRAVDLWDAAQAIGTDVERIQPLIVA